MNTVEMQERFAALLGRLAEETACACCSLFVTTFSSAVTAFRLCAPVFRRRDASGSALRGGLAVGRSWSRRRASACASRHGPLVEEMVATVEKERGALPLLAFAAARLWEERDRERKLLTRAAYERISGVEGSSRRARGDDAASSSDRNARRLVREIFRNLVTAEGTRAAREREELLSVFAAPGSGREEAEAVLEASWARGC